MGACLDKPKEKKTKINVNQKSEEGTKPAINKKKKGEERAPEENAIKAPKLKKMTLNELLLTYSIENTLQLSSKLQGPKYLSNIVDGSSKVLRVLTQNQIQQKRLEVYKQMIGFQIYQSDEGSLLLLDDYCSGEDLFDLTDKFRQTQKQYYQAQLLKILESVFIIISQFHKNKVWLGNLNLSSFKQISNFKEEIRLVDFNLTGTVTKYEKMGVAHKQSYEADYEFLGYLVQYLVHDQPPMFIPHKMQYIEFQIIPHENIIQSLLKGKKCIREDLAQIPAQSIVLSQKMSLGYRFRRDVNKLLKMRKKRKAHNRKLYGTDLSALIPQGKFSEESAYRLQTERIFQRINGYIFKLKSPHQQAFLNYAGDNDNLRRLKQVFLLNDVSKKMSELKDLLSNIN